MEETGKTLECSNQKIFFKSSERMDEIENESITLVVTSPPYWNVRDYGSLEQIGHGQTYDSYIESLNVVWKECLKKLQPNGKICINIQPLPISSEHSGYGYRVIKNIMFDIEKFFIKNDCFLSGMNYWDKSSYINNVSWGSYPKPTNIATNTSFEQIFTFVKRGKTRKIDQEKAKKSLLTKDEWRHWAVRCIWDDISPVLKINSEGKNTFGHSAPFPEDIPYRLIRMHTIEGEKVLDPFLGSGTTLKICRILNREGFGYEINPEYKEKIKNRILEDWKPPSIESYYSTIGIATLAKILKTTISETKKRKFIQESSEQTLEHILSVLKERNIISKVQKEKITELKGKKLKKVKKLESFF